MNELSKTILESYQVRKTRAQKLRFEALLREHGVSFTVNEGGLIKSRNLIVGDPKTAKVLLTAHYDTCARLPFPNMVFPKNFLFTLLYGFLFAVPMLLGMVLGISLVIALFQHFRLPEGWIPGLIMLNNCFWLFLLFFMLLGPIANRHTANDNTSGVIALIELMDALDEETKRKVAFVFFDNEENGLLGSGLYRKTYRKEIRRQLIVNFDCVSDGDRMLAVCSKGAWKLREQLIFVEKDGKIPLVEKSSRAFYPSDQMGFPNGIGVAMLKKGPLGLYLGKIHTDRDRVFDESNLRYLCEQWSRAVYRVVHTSS